MNLALFYIWDGERNGNPLQYSRLENPMDRGMWRAMLLYVEESLEGYVHTVAKS